ncbi:hypothetical protein ALQ93_101807 [Pseudomonas syringae pv. pisi]|uniref:Uncharacterized protein n=3 Tax=Pseudomonas syringae group TaxID=136849 RepID=A0A3M3CBG3_PSESJ|nr:hypothetical protein ALQ93_101807 [Pseudomonas syringae pv. pisi]RMU72033.1 hypothetical protein ALP24_102188 [Pseudomonas syringae pv. aptata]RMU92690.1 hypothetical protein ALP21_101558 [Pseudomonas savastanoi pv. phaseolicola]RML60505.1 hypothetical protein ALQ92_101514 [Pseudomonas syringae pv. pisi]RMM22237.1 hypothetical protein ALQ82_101484 [Pseudomonas syringae pv. pisi]
MLYKPVIDRPVPPDQQHDHFEHPNYADSSTQPIRRKRAD